MKILAIETSCDETAAAVLTEKDGQPLVLSNVVSSQIDIHKAFGGVVPEVAARAHIESVIPVIQKALIEAKTDLGSITEIAVTYGPGLVGSLVVGVETAKAISASCDIPLIPVNHLEGHIYANFICEIANNKLQIAKKEPQFPIVALLVSGGHTLLIYMEDHLSYKVIGQTRDDAAGEAFDKGAKIMDLPYPGGPEISKLAKKGDEASFKFPVIDLTGPPKRNSQGFLEYPEESLDFSFSGLKTALLTQVKNLKEMTQKNKGDLAASFQKAVVLNLIQNSLRAVKKYQPQTFILSGGVAANEKLRETLKADLKKVAPNLSYLIPDPFLCTDNAAMIGAAAFYHIKKGEKSNLNFSPQPNLKL